MADNLTPLQKKDQENKRSEAMDNLIKALNENTKSHKDGSNNQEGGRKSFSRAALNVIGGKALSGILSPFKEAINPVVQPIKELGKDIEKERGVEEIEKKDKAVTATKEGGDSYSLLQQISANVDSIKDLMVKGAEADEMAAREKVTDTDFQKDAEKITEVKEKKEREEPEKGFNLLGLVAGISTALKSGLAPLAGIGTAIGDLASALGVSKFLPAAASRMGKAPVPAPTSPDSKSAAKTAPQTKQDAKTKTEPKTKPKAETKQRQLPPRDAKGRFTKAAPQATRLSNFASKATGIVSRFGVPGMAVAATAAGAYKGTEYLLKETETGKKVSGFMSGLIGKIDAGLSDELTDRERITILNNREEDYKKAQEVLLKDETVSKEDKAKLLKIIQGAQMNMNPGSNDAAIDDQLQNTSDALVKELLKPTALDMSPPATPQTQALTEDSLKPEQTKTGDVAMSSTNIDSSSSSKQVIINQQPHVPVGF